MEYSVNWIIWRANITLTTCLECATRNGKIFFFDDLMRIGEPQLHPNCRCFLNRITKQTLTIPEVIATGREYCFPTMD